MTKKLLSICLFLSATFFIQAQTTVSDSIYTGGMWRSYKLYKPAIYTGATARPLIINMHGYTSNADQQQAYSNFMPIADTANFLMVFPNGTYNSGQRYWNAGISSFGVDDISFLSRLIDSLKLQYNINLNRVYATGMSNGGFMSNTLACELSNRITAIASVTGGMFTTQYGSVGSACHPKRPVPVMQVHGTNDPTVPYAGNSSMLPVDTLIKYWVRKNNCNTTPTFSNVPNTNTSDGCTASHYIYTGGNLGSSVELFKITGGEHTWPGAPFTIGVTNQDISASKEIWRFFNKYNLASLTAIEDFENQKIGFSVYPNPASDVLTIKLDNDTQNNTTFKLNDVIGNEIYSIKNISNNVSVNTSQLPAGIYFVTLINEQGKSTTQKIIKE